MRRQGESIAERLLHLARSASGVLDTGSVAPDAEPAPVPEVELLELVRTGALGQEYLARKGDEPLLVQRYPCDGVSEWVVARFLEEARALEAAVHPGLARIAGGGRLADGSLYIARERLASARPLAERLRDPQPFSIGELSAIVLSVLDALAYLHELGILHRDLGPHAILLSGGGELVQPKLVGFGQGLLREALPPAQRESLWSEGYTAPECTAGASADVRSDLYAIGAMLQELITGAPPYVGSPPGTLVAEPARLRVVAPIDHLARIEPAVRRCLAVDPAARFGTVAELSHTLREAGLGTGTAVALSDHPSRDGSTHPAAGPPARPGDVVGSYELLELIGQGSMGCVFLARHTRLGRKVALKLMRADHARSRDLIQRFFHEARAVNQISHEHIVEVFDFVEEPERGRAWYVMELLSGASLGQLLGKEDWTIQRIARTVRQVCDALQAAHRLGVVHRDVKPDNIFVSQREDGSEYVKVLDFGVAKLLAPIGSAPVDQGTLDGMIIGTPAYMAPEQAAGLGVDHRADIYALGVVLYQMLSGRLPYDAPTFGQMLAAVIKEPIPPLGRFARSGERIPRRLSALVSQCLEKEPARRPQTMAAVGKALAPYCQGHIHVPHPRREWSVAALVAGTVIAAGWLFWPRPLLEVQAAVPAPQAPRALEPLTAPPMPAPGGAIAVNIASQPTGAKIVRLDTGEVLGRTPFTGAVAIEHREATLRLELSGHRPVEQTIRLDRNADVRVVLPARRVPATAKTSKGRLGRDGVMDPFAE